MKKRGFSLTEIIIILFTVAVIATIILPMKIIDLNQAERIAKWKSFYPQLKYSLELMKANEKNFIKDYNNNININPDVFFYHYIKYLNVDNKKVFDNGYFRYHHYFMNGKIIKSISKYHADQFIALKNGMIIGFTGFARSSLDRSEPIGVLFVDLDGYDGKNFIGRDVFLVLMYDDKIEPAGINSSIQEMKEDCSPIGSGVKCAAYYLIGNSF